MSVDLFVVLFVVNSVKESHFFQSSCKYEQYIHKYCFMITFAISVCSSVSEWNAVDNCALICSCLHNIFQNVKINWSSWSDTIVSDNSCSLNMFFVKTSATSITSSVFSRIMCLIFVSWLTTIMTFMYSLLFDSLTMKSIEISHHCLMRMNKNLNTSCFFACQSFSWTHVWQNCTYLCTKLCISDQ